ncbi:hypothetical protein B0H11DRAFT_585294 [Mycena galericulata]|nr:hypothetical protein B0H11DRAFT_585294 [Mycena galericulata]
MNEATPRTPECTRAQRQSRPSSRLRRQPKRRGIAGHPCMTLSGNWGHEPFYTDSFSLQSTVLINGPVLRRRPLRRSAPPSTSSPSSPNSNELARRSLTLRVYALYHRFFASLLYLDTQKKSDLLSNPGSRIKGRQMEASDGLHTFSGTVTPPRSISFSRPSLSPPLRRLRVSPPPPASSMGTHSRPSSNSIVCPPARATAASVQARLPCAASLGTSSSSAPPTYLRMRQ